MKQTAQLRGLLSHYQTLLSPEEYQSFSQEVDRLLKHYYEVLNAHPPGIARAQKIHELVEEQVAASSHIKTSCQKGCGACCHLEVEITEDDAALMALSIVEQNLQFDEASLEEQSQRERLDPKWNQGAVKSNRCVMLGADNACRNYDFRPTVCRKHSVTSPAIDCSTLGATPVPRLIPMNEIILSAAINLPQNNFGALPKMLASALNQLKEVRHMHQLDFKETPAERPLESSQIDKD
ncbi:Flagellin N-methylase [compost metagenome]